VKKIYLEIYRDNCAEFRQYIRKGNFNDFGGCSDMRQEGIDSLNGE